MEEEGTAANRTEEKGNSSSSDSGVLHVVVQRCTKAKLLIDAESDTWTEIGRGLVIYISFAQGALPEGQACTRFLHQAVKSILSAPLSSSDKWQADHTDAESVIALCRRGEKQGVLVVPQASLVSKLELGDRNLKYYRQCGKEDANRLYHGFVDMLKVVARELIVGPTAPKCLDAASWKALQDERAKSAAIAPEEYFKCGENEGKYSRYDDRGVPTHDADGNEIAKSQSKKLDKIYAAQVKKYAKNQPSQGIEDGKESKEESPAEADIASKPQGATQEQEAETEQPLPEGACLPDVRHGTFGGRQGFEMMSAGPLTHAFVF